MSPQRRVRSSHDTGWGPLLVVLSLGIALGAWSSTILRKLADDAATDRAVEVRDLWWRDRLSRAGLGGWEDGVFTLYTQEPE